MAEADLRAAVLRYQAHYGQLRSTTMARVVALWRALGGVDDDDLVRFVAAAVPVVEGAQRAATALLAAYVASTLRLAGIPTRPVVIEPPSILNLRGVESAEVYARPVVMARTALARGKLWAEAMELGAQRAEQLAASDVAMAQRRAMLRAVQDDDRIVGYRRVLTGLSCSLCAAASTQRYHKADLMPIHARCDCGVAPIIGTIDPGQVINRQLVKELKAVAATTGSKSWYRNRHTTVDEDGTVRLPEIAVHRHGELGPVLGDAGHKFAGPSVAA